MLTTVLLLSPVFVTLFWAVVLHLYQKENNPPKRFLGKLMIVAFILYLSHFFYFQKLYGAYIWLDCFYNLASLSVFPMYYVYARLLTIDEHFSFRRHYVYFLAPVVIFVALCVGYIIMNNEEEFIYVKDVIYGVSHEEGILAFIYWIFITEKVVFVSQLSIYAVLTSRLIMRHRELVDNQYSFSENLSLRWVQVFNITLSLASVISAASVIYGRESFVDDPARLAFPAIFFSTILFIIAVQGNNQKPVKIIEFNELAEGELLDDKIPDKLRDSLTGLFEEEHIYLKNDLTIYDVTERLGTNRTYVSRIINNEFGLNFTTFVNNYRVEHSKKLMREGRSVPLEEVAELSGFGSVNSLYRAFLIKEKTSLPHFRKTLGRRR